MHSLVVIEFNGEEELRFGLKGSRQDCAVKGMTPMGDTVPRKALRRKVKN